MLNGAIESCLPDEPLFPYLCLRNAILMPCTATLFKDAIRRERMEGTKPKERGTRRKSEILRLVEDARPNQ